ncbi:glycosyltransferase [Alphaproteobacteria bacterium]|jgi:ubiquinone/menaquinone biosynthesis C-methylase UbiE|nr:glycosyltransferase [Alphaproteobacteria bacterium]
MTVAKHKDRKTIIRESADRIAPDRDKWIERNAFYYEQDRDYMRFLIPEGQSVLDLGCGAGDLLASLKPSRGVGVDFSNRMIEIAKGKYPDLKFAVADIEKLGFTEKLGGPFDVIVLSDTLGLLDDCEATLALLHDVCTPDTRLVVSYYSPYWELVLRLGDKLGFRMPQPEVNYLSTADIENLLHLADFEVIKTEWRQLLPKRLLGLGALVNRFIGTLPLLRRFCLRTYVVARPLRGAEKPGLSASVVIPCRNEKGNIEPAIQRLERFADDVEVIYVEGHSSDGTLEECERVKAAYPDWDIKVTTQDGRGKGNAVWKAFDMASGDVLMILDADLTMPPEQLPKFFNAIASGKGEFINGSRLVYPMEQGAMRFLNLIANRLFAAIFSYLLNQRFTDTLCGTKVMRRSDYRRIADNRSYFGDFDPFGDFDLIFGAAKLNMKITEIPIRYADRTYGETQISRFRDGWELIKMVVFAWRKLKAF